MEPQTCFFFPPVVYVVGYCSARYTIITRPGKEPYAAARGFPIVFAPARDDRKRRAERAPHTCCGDTRSVPARRPTVRRDDVTGRRNADTVLPTRRRFSRGPGFPRAPGKIRFRRAFIDRAGGARVARKSNKCAAFFFGLPLPLPLSLQCICIRGVRPPIDKRRRRRVVTKKRYEEGPYEKITTGRGR